MKMYKSFFFYFTDEPSAPSLRLSEALETSLNFTWDKYQHCNSDIIMVQYEFELRKVDDDLLVHSGSETNTFLFFNLLESHTEYNLRVRVSTLEFSKGISQFSTWNWIKGTTAGTKTTPRPVFGMCLSWFYVFQCTQQIYATQDSSGVCHSMPQFLPLEWRKEEEEEKTAYT